jgi:hypothetical protein
MQPKNREKICGLAQSTHYFLRIQKQFINKMGRIKNDISNGGLGPISVGP